VGISTAWRNTVSIHPIRPPAGDLLSKTIMTVLRPAALSRGGDERQIAFEPIAHASDPSFFLRMIFSKGQ
jgi:hypothetical protein